ncbi:lipid A deacylase LpxR family protein [Filimonas effusa]|uniref:Lipid A deacylase LpxR family protein n=1 Tax=Filimonas effusa TaxID=2508721 RepID=A0A4Q1D0Z9_9BACT|nr:lipid A deacylase LpxR family protein [Filimonas effusa]RXK81446.1 lipid A deacylase LpxR family protein [Filimonas effusa]
MKAHFNRFLLLLVVSVTALAAQGQEFRHLLKGFDDNDGIDIRGMGTDDGYTNGTGIDLYRPAARPRAFINALMPKAGDSAFNTSGWGIMQVMYTPTEIRTYNPDPNDYHFGGGLYIKHSLHSADKRRKLNLQSELLLGIMGPASLASNFQKLIHSIGGFYTPRGWDHQLPTDLLLNYNFTAEKQLCAIGEGLDINAGGTAMLGSLQTSAQVYTLFRFGKKFSYYEGFIQQYCRPNTPGKKQWQLYGILQPGLQWTGYQAMYQGGLLNSQSPLNNNSKIHGQAHATMRPEPFLAHLDFGIIASSGGFGILWKQSLRTREVQHMTPRSVGTISVQIAW